MAAKILIAGLGYVGIALAERLLSSGHQVWGLKRRSPPEVLLRQSGFTWLEADLTNINTLQRGIPEVDYVFYMPSPSERSIDAYRQIYFQGMKNLMQVLSSGVRRFFYISSTSVFGQLDGTWVDEETPVTPSSPWSEVIAQAEDDLLKQEQFPATVLRCGGIYGPGRTRLIQRIWDGLEALDPADDRFTNRIHRDDAAKACEFLMEKPDCLAIYHLVDRDPACRNVMIRWVSEEYQRPLPPVSQQVPEELRGNKRISSKRLRDSGYEFIYPTFREGYRSLLDTLAQAHS